MRSLFALVVFLAGLIAWPLAAHAVYTYKVVGVRSDDRLNVRKDFPGTPDYKVILGSFGPKETGIIGTGRAFMHNDQRWVEVRVNGAAGWANSKYLEEEYTGWPDRVWTQLSCGGTEPFWSLTIGKTSAKFKALYKSSSDNEEEFSITRRDGANNPSIKGFRLDSLSQGARMSAIIAQKQWCSDGMSDTDFGFQIFLWEEGSTDGILTGCCSLAR